MRSLEQHEGSVAPNAKAIPTAARRAIWPHRLVGSQIGSVPRDREGQFHTQTFERYSRYEPHIAEGLTHMFVAGTSTRHPSAKWLKPCWESLEVGSTISRLNQSLTQPFEAWRQRRLPSHWRVLYLDGVHFSIRHGDQADSTLILTALAVDLEGNKEVLALRACAEEDKEGRVSVLQDLRTRGATQFDLLVTDGHDGVLAAIGHLFAATPRQRCLVHKQRDVMSAIKRRERSEVQAELVAIWQPPTKQEALVQLATSTRHIWETLSGGGEKLGGRGREDLDV